MQHWSRLLTSSTMVAVLLSVVVLQTASAHTLTTQAISATRALHGVATRYVFPSASPTFPTSGTFNIKNELTGLCIGIKPGQPISYAGDWACNTNNDQEWQWDHSTCDASGFYCRIKNDSGLCLGVYGASTKAGARIVAWACNTNKDQKWETFANCYAGGLVYADLNTGMVIQIANTSNGAPLTQEPETDALTQCWS